MNSKREIEALDEALLYLNEGLFSFNKKKNENDKYFDKYYQFYYNEFKQIVEAEKSGTLIQLMSDEGPLDGYWLYYLGWSASKFDSEVKKYIKNNPDVILGEDDYNLEYMTDNATIEFFKANDHIIVGDNGGGDNLIYFLKNKFFLEWYHDEKKQADLNRKISYSDLMKEAKERFRKNNQYHDDIEVDAAIAADKDLGYNKLSNI